MIVIAMVAAIAGFLFSKNYFNNPNQTSQASQVIKPEFKALLLYPTLKSFTGFQLQSHDNPNLTIEDFQGHWTLLFFGFTHCPDVCPTTLTELQKVFKLITTNQKPEVLFVSVDPERDTPQSLKEYTNFFNPDFNSATGDVANIIAIASQVGVAYHIEDHETGNVNYSVDHTAAVFLVNPDKQLYGIFRSPHDAKNIAHDLMLLLDNK